jgi:hypothetical protein
MQLRATSRSIDATGTSGYRGNTPVEQPICSTITVSSMAGMPQRPEYARLRRRKLLGQAAKHLRNRPPGLDRIVGAGGTLSPETRLGGENYGRLMTRLARDGFDFRLERLSRNTIRRIETEFGSARSVSHAPILGDNRF